MTGIEDTIRQQANSYARITMGVGTSPDLQPRDSGRLASAIRVLEGAGGILHLRIAPRVSRRDSPGLGARDTCGLRAGRNLFPM